MLLQFIVLTSFIFLFFTVPITKAGGGAENDRFFQVLILGGNKVRMTTHLTH